MFYPPPFYYQEEYKPDQADPDFGEDDEDDDEDGGEAQYVKKSELEELVNGCWETIAGETVNLTGTISRSSTVVPVVSDVPKSITVSFGVKVDGKVDGNKCAIADADLPDTTNVEGIGGNKSSSTSNGNDMDNQMEVDVTGAVGITSSSTSTSVIKSPTSKNSSNHTNAPTVPKSEGEGPTVPGSTYSGLNMGRSSVISSLFSQIMAGEKPSDVCIEGMPVSAIRKLVARQMSMACQLLLQILLQADDTSDCFTKVGR